MCYSDIYNIYLYYACNGFLLLWNSQNGAQWLCLVGQMILRRFLVRFFLSICPPLFCSWSQMSSFYLSPKHVCWMPWPEEFAMCSSKCLSSTHLCLCHANLVCHCWFAMHLHHLCVCTFAISQQFGKLHMMWFFTCCLGPTPPTLAYFLTKCSTLVVFHES